MRGESSYSTGGWQGNRPQSLPAFWGVIPPPPLPPRAPVAPVPPPASTSASDPLSTSTFGNPLAPRVERRTGCTSTVTSAADSVIQNSEQDQGTARRAHQGVDGSAQYSPTRPSAPKQSRWDSTVPTSNHALPTVTSASAARTLDFSRPQGTTPAPARAPSTGSFPSLPGPAGPSGDRNSDGVSSMLRQVLGEMQNLDAPADNSFGDDVALLSFNPGSGSTPKVPNRDIGFAPDRAQEVRNLDQSICDLLNMDGLPLIEQLAGDCSTVLTVNRGISVLKAVVLAFRHSPPTLENITAVYDMVAKLLKEVRAPFGAVGNASWQRFSLSLALVKEFLDKKIAQTELASVQHLSARGSPYSTPADQSTHGSLAGSGHTGLSPQFGALSTASSELLRSALTSLPRLDGHVFDSWLTQFENIIVHSLQLNVKEIKLILGTKVAPEFGSQLRRIMSMNSWQEIKEFLVEQFSATPTRMAALYQWQYLQQGDLPILRYNQQVEDLLARTNGGEIDTCEPDKVLGYIRGLNDRALQRKLLNRTQDLSKPLYLQEAFKQARTNEHSAQLMAGVFGNSFTTDSVVAAPAATTAAPVGFGSTPSLASGSPAPRPDTNPHGPCDLHYADTHTNAMCRVRYMACPYCKLNLTYEQIANRAHAAVCTAPRCGTCTRPGHTSETCRDNRNGGHRSRGRDRDRSNSRDRDYRRRSNSRDNDRSSRYQSSSRGQSRSPGRVTFSDQNTYHGDSRSPSGRSHAARVADLSDGSHSTSSS